MNILCGSLPPPFNGAAAVNKLVFDKFHRLPTKALEVKNTFTQNNSTFVRRATRLFVFSTQLLAVYKKSKRVGVDKLYVSLNGGWAIWMDVITILVFNRMASRILIHHHSYRYIQKKRVAIRVLLRIKKRRQIHIFLCQNMLNAFRDRYKFEIHYMSAKVVKNHFALDEEFIVAKIPKSSQRSTTSFGFLGRISPEKGFPEFLEFIKRVQKLNLNWNFYIAGPCEKRYSYLIEELMKLDSSRIKYFGEIIGDKRTEFYDSLDFLIFPSNYRDEAQPLVILESLVRGVTVIAKERGCYQKLAEEGLVVLPESSSWSEDALSYILGHDELFASSRYEIREKVLKDYFVQTKLIHAIISDGCSNDD